jgi:hypothetical protein
LLSELNFQKLNADASTCRTLLPAKCREQSMVQYMLAIDITEILAWHSTTLGIVATI